MSIDKKIINKETICSSNLEQINKLFKADVKIMDVWSTNFYSNFNNEYLYYQELREVIEEDTKFLSDLSKTMKHEKFNKLKNLSNIYLNLIKDPKWVDLLLAGDILKVNVPHEISGYFSKLTEFFIDEIDKKFNK